MQVWIPDWMDKKMPLKVPVPNRFHNSEDYKEYVKTIEESNKRMHDLRKNFVWWLDWWDSSRPRTGTYESSVLETCLEYAKQDLFNNKVR